jgi:Ca2+-binding EF-hand superfamily protein
MAGTLLRLYDADENGALDYEEVKRISGEWILNDADADGVVTVDELAARLSAYQAQASAEQDTGPTSPTEADVASQALELADDSPIPNSVDQEERPALRLPAWFVARDADRDGQVKMVEFTDKWTDAKAVEFVRIDRNGNGIISSQESLQAEPPKEVQDDGKAEPKPAEK